MKVFLTGASGYIGNGVAKAFAKGGHEVFGLVRSVTAAKELQKSEIHPILGTIADLPKEAHTADALIHCAFENAETDQVAVEALLQTPPKILVYTSGVWVYGNRTEPVDEESPLKPLDLVTWRPPVEQKILKSHHHSIVIRPGHVYGYNKGILAMLFESAAKGKLEIAGNGENHWPVVHLEDLAELYLLAVEKRLKDQILNGTDNGSVKVKELAAAIGKLANTSPHYLPLPAALEQFGPFAEGLAVNQPHILNKKALQLLGWRPRHNNLLISINNYWKTWNSYS